MFVLYSYSIASWKNIKWKHVKLKYNQSRCNKNPSYDMDDESDLIENSKTHHRTKTRSSFRKVGQRLSERQSKSRRGVKEPLSPSWDLAISRV